MTDENATITPEMAVLMNQLASGVYDKYSEIIEIPEVSLLPSRLGDILYFEMVENFEENIINLESAIPLPPEWVVPKKWVHNVTPTTKRYERVLDYTDWNRWYTDLNILLNTEDIPEQWDELNVNRYKSVWDGNASLEWEE